MVQKKEKSPYASPAEHGAANLITEVEIVYAAPRFAFPSPVTGSESCFHLFQAIFDERKLCLKELFYVALFNNANYCIGYSLIGLGNTSGVMVNVKEIFQLAILTNASAIAICHNHPSGKLSPSTSDISMTQKIKDAADLLEIRLLDHIIISHAGYYSFVDEGLL